MAQTETIQYEVLDKHDNIEVRQYDSILLASTKTDPKNYLDSGFNNVFNYISGKNEQNTKISMTTPVVTYEEDEKLVTGFYVPSKYNKETVPQPTSGKVYINEIKKALYVVIRFSGRWKEDSFNKHNKILLKYIKESPYSIVSQDFIMRYNAPYVPGPLRRNEIAYQVKKGD